MSKRHYLVIGALLVLTLAFAGGAAYYSARRMAEVAGFAGEAESPLNRPAAASLGAAEAKVTIVEFFDPACESCRMMYPYVKSLLRTYDGKLRLSLRYAPFHDGSDAVVKLLEAARLQGDAVYWKTLETILAQQPVWADHGRPDPQRVWSMLDGTGLDLARARKDLDDPRIAALLRQDARDVAALKLTKTPSFFINGEALAEFGPFGLRAQVEREIRRRYE